MEELPGLESASPSSSDGVVKFGVPCLICGVDLDIVKQEVDEGENNITDDDAEQNEYILGHLTAAAATTTNSPPSQDFQIESLSKEEEDRIFHYFLKWFRVGIVKTGKQRQVSKKGWGGNGGEPLRFCGDCQRPLRGLLELQTKLDELERAMRNEVDKMTHKMEACEDVFETNKIYERDVRYRRVRSKIVKCVRPASKSTVKPRVKCTTNQLLKPEPTDNNGSHVDKTSERKSARRKTAVSRFNPCTKQDPFYETTLPVVMLTSNDKITAEQHLVSSQIKTSNSKNSTSATASANSPKKAKILKNKKRKKEERKKLSKLKPKESFLKSDTLGITVEKSNVKVEDAHNYILAENYFESADDGSDPDNEAQLDEKYSKNQIKRRKWKVEDDDYVVKDDDGDDNLSNDEDDDWNELDESRMYLKYAIDPEKKVVTIGKYIFNMLDPSEKLECVLCNGVVNHVKSQIRSHVIRLHTNNFACKQCSYRSSNKRGLQIHAQAVHQGIRLKPNKSYCKICGKPIYRSHRKQHEWTHKSQEEKQEYLARGDPLPNHLKKMHQCDECGRNLCSLQQLKLHKERVHGGEEGQKSRMELCPDCGGTYLDLRSHIKMVHTKKEDQRFYECMEGGCGRKFRTLSQLTKHKDAVHRKIRLWKCDMCPREFSREVTFKNHINLHLGIRPWQCESCPSAFITKAQLQRHTRIFHTAGSQPKRKVYLRGPTVLGADFRKDELQKKGTYYPPSALATWAAGRVPGHLMEAEQQETKVVDM